MTIKYVGNGTHIPGVPARDLTPEEYALHKKIIAAEQKASGVVLYEVQTSETKEESK